MKDNETLQSLLQIKEPWSLVDLRFDPSRARCDAWISLEQPRGWFGFTKNKQYPTRTWRHVNIGEWRLYVHVMAPDGTNLTKQPWTGEIGQPFSRMLEKQISDMLSHVHSPEKIGILLGLETLDLTRAYSNGRLNIPKPANIHNRGSVGMGDSGEANNENIPPPEDAIWLKIINGSHPIQIKAVGLQLFLFNIRLQYKSTENPEQHQHFASECRNFFKRNQRQLAFELGQIAATNPPSKPSKGTPAGEGK